jgi:hypothetical protein
MSGMRAWLFNKPGFGYGSAHSDVDATMFQNPVLAARIAGLVAGLAIPTVNADAQESKTAITCINPMSGTSWQIAIDFDRATVNSNRAEITAAKIAWFDPTDGSNYTLDRKSGALTAIVASSTGGYFRHARCSLEKSR